MILCPCCQLFFFRKRINPVSAIKCLTAYNLNHNAHMLQLSAHAQEDNSNDQDIIKSWYAELYNNVYLSRLLDAKAKPRMKVCRI